MSVVTRVGWFILKSLGVSEALDRLFGSDSEEAKKMTSFAGLNIFILLAAIGVAVFFYFKGRK